MSHIPHSFVYFLIYSSPFSRTLLLFEPYRIPRFILTKNSCPYWATFLVPYLQFTFQSSEASFLCNQLDLSFLVSCLAPFLYSMEDTSSLPVSLPSAPSNNLLTINTVFQDHCLPTLLSKGNPCMVLCDFPSRIPYPPSHISIYGLEDFSIFLKALSQHQSDIYIYISSLKAFYISENCNLNHVRSISLSPFLPELQIVLLENSKSSKFSIVFPMKLLGKSLLSSIFSPFPLRPEVKKAHGPNTLICFN